MYIGCWDEASAWDRREGGKEVLKESSNLEGFPIN